MAKLRTWVITEVKQEIGRSGDCDGCDFDQINGCSVVHDPNIDCAFGTILQVKEISDE